MVVNKEDEQRFKQNEVQTMRWMCCLPLQDKKPNAELPSGKLGTERISKIIAEG